MMPLREMGTSWEWISDILALLGTLMIVGALCCLAVALGVSPT